MKTKLRIVIQSPDVDVSAPSDLFEELVAGPVEVIECDAIDAALAVRISVLALSGAEVRISRMAA